MKLLQFRTAGTACGNDRTVLKTDRILLDIDDGLKVDDDSLGADCKLAPGAQKLLRLRLRCPHAMFGSVRKVDHDLMVAVLRV